MIGIVTSFLRMNEITNALGVIFTMLGVLLPLFQKGSSDSQSVLLSSPASITTGQEQGKSPPERNDIPSAIPGSTKKMGILVVYMNRRLLDTYVYLTFGFDRVGTKFDAVARVEEYRKNNRMVFAALFLDLPTCNYTVRSDALGIEEKFTLRSRTIVELDWRRRTSSHIMPQLQADSSTNGV